MLESANTTVQTVSQKHLQAHADAHVLYATLCILVNLSNLGNEHLVNLNLPEDRGLTHHSTWWSHSA